MDKTNKQPNKINYRNGGAIRKRYEVLVKRGVAPPLKRPLGAQAANPAPVAVKPSEPVARSSPPQHQTTLPGTLNVCRREVGRMCQHNRRRYYCKECGGNGICQHNRRRDRCKECCSPCQHNIRRYKCKDCGSGVSRSTSSGSRSRSKRDLIGIYIANSNEKQKPHGSSHWTVAEWEAAITKQQLRNERTQAQFADQLVGPLEVDQIVDKRMKNQKVQYLVRWKVQLDYTALFSCLSQAVSNEN
jgi:hypothetical protein